MSPWGKQEKRLVGFNLLNLFSLRQGGPRPFEAGEFQLIAGWGFNFVRLPIDYRFLIREDESVDQLRFALLDPAVELAERFDLHLNINLHHAPGFCINTPRHTWTLWTDPGTQRRFIALWEAIARHYQDAGARVSFNLVNEATGSDLQTYTTLMRRTAQAIQAIDAAIPIIIDGHDVGRTPVPGVADLGLGQSVHCYAPHWFTHYQASWVFRDGDPYLQAPEYPGSEPQRRDGRPSDTRTWNKERMEEFFAPWQELRDAGVMVHCGEMGVFNTTPRAATIRWFTDVLGILQQLGMGWSLWNLEGSFGIIESRRPGGKGEQLPDGRWLDTELLRLLQAYA
jgi:endoglucanase